MKNYNVYQVCNKFGPSKPIYTGMTARTLHQRWQNHTAAANRGVRNEPILQALRSRGTDNLKLVLVESFTVKRSASRLERRLIKAETHISLPGKNGTNMRRW